MYSLVNWHFGALRRIHWGHARPSALANVMLVIAMMTAGLFLGVAGQKLQPAHAVDLPLPSTTQISIGVDLGCALDITGTAYCWGNDYAYKGNANSTNEVLRPTKVVTANPSLRFVQIGVGWGHACALAVDHTTWCWGIGADGRLGNNTTTDQWQPQMVVLSDGTTAAQFDQISVGNQQACGLTTDGTAQCWGNNEAGALGNASNTDSTKAVNVDGAVKFKAISVGSEFTCAIAADDLGYCWGKGWDGELGNSVWANQNTPQKVGTAGTQWWSFDKISAGGNHTCGIEKTSKKIYCWGLNQAGELGTGDLSSSATPVTEAARSTQYTQVIAGDAVTCAITTTNATQCWGTNNDGAAGINAPNHQLSPVTLTGAPQFASISTTKTENAPAMCGVENSTNKIYCWGNGTSARFGMNTTPLHQYPPAEVPGAYAFSQFAGGGFENCLLDASGTPMCWGMGWSGGLGLGDFTSRAVPTALSSLSLSQISRSDYHACGVSKKTGEIGKIYCWGGDSYGQLGKPATNNITTPTAIDENTKTFTKVVTGAEHTCALTTDELVYCWGRNNNGQIGQSSGTTQNATPTAVSATIKFRDITAGAHFTCGITSASYADGGTAYTDANRLFCWGSDSDGQQANGATTGNVYTPTIYSTSPSLTFKSVSAGWLQACALTDASPSDAYCWGQDGANGANAWNGDQTTPKILPNTSGSTNKYASISSLEYGMCALDTAGKVFCWGFNGHGQLGLAPDATWTGLPTAIGGTYTFASIFGGMQANTTCGITTDTKYVCWGENTINQAMTLPSPRYLTPTQIYFASGSVGALAQYHADGITAIATGGTSLSNSVVLKATVNSLSATDQLKLCVEAQPVGTAFTNTEANIKCGATAVTTGNTASVTVDGLSAGTTYHWQASTLGSESGLSNSTSYGGNAESATDFSTQAEPNPTTLGFAQLAMSRDTTCGINHEGKVYCWGDGSWGRIGDSAGDSNWRLFNRPIPTPIASSASFTRITAGRSHFCGLTGTEIYCWGSNWAGQLGDGTNTSHSKPVKVNVATAFADVAAGDEYTCARSTQGYLWCWGYGANYRLGNNSTANQTSPVQPSGVTTTAFSSLSVGVGSACALRSADSTLMCWGYNGNGTVGNGTTTHQPIPVAITGTWKSVAVGAYHACAIASPSGEVSCWGRNSSAQLGDGTTTNRSVPTPTSGRYVATSLVVGMDFTCALGNARTTQCWGSNSYGQLGDGTTTQRASPTNTADSSSMRSLFTGPYALGVCGLQYGTDIPLCWGRTNAGVLNEATYQLSNPSPAAVTHVQTYTAIVIGQKHGCGLTAAGEVYCWGSNELLQSGATVDTAMPTKVSGTMTFTQISAGMFHTCGITSAPIANAAYCWGDNDYGKLGDGSSSNRMSPTRVVNGTSSGLFSSISAGGSHTCAIQAGSNKYVYCWGRNSYGQLGDNTQTGSVTPVKVNNTTNYDEVLIGGDSFTCARSGTAVDCWGENDLYQLGLGNTTNQSSPTAVAGSYSAISVGMYHTCAIASADSTLRCWGADWGGLSLNSGDGHTPSPSGGGRTFAQVSAGETLTCGKLLSTAEIWCNGKNTAGQIGVGSIDENYPMVNQMTQVTGGVTWKTSTSALATGSARTANCAYSASDALYCWGDNTNNQFGNRSYAYKNTPTAMRFLSAHASTVAQYDNSDVVLPAGDATALTTVKFKGTVSDLEPTDTAKFCVEVKPVGTAFDDSGVSCSTAAANGLQASVTVSGLATNTGYHWRWRMESTLYAKQLWQLYGNNLESSADFSIDSAAPTVTSLVQVRADGTTPIATGEWRNNASIKLGATPSDARPTSQICVRYAAVGSTSFMSACGSLSASGTAQLVAVTPSDGAWYWQVQAIDALGNASAWIDYNSDGMSNRDVGIDTTSPSVPSAPAQYRSDGTTAIPAAGFTNESSVKLQGTVSDALTNVQLCVRAVDHANRGLAGTESCSVLGASGAQYTQAINALSANTEYDWEYWAIDAAGNASSHTWYNGAGPSFATDTVAATAGQVYDGLNAPAQESFNDGSLNTLSGSWTDFATTGAAVSRYEYAIGTTPGGTDVAAWTNTGWVNTGSPKTVTRTGLGLHTGQLYFISIRAVDTAGNTSAVATSPGQMVAPTLVFAASATSIDFGALNATNSYTANGNVTLTTSTNAYNGYVLTTSATSAMSTGTVDIPQSVGGTWASPTATPGIGLAYSSSGTGGYADTKFADGTYWAAMPMGAAEIFANHPSSVTGSPISNEEFMLLLRLKASATQAAGLYTSAMTVTCTVSY